MNLNMHTIYLLRIHIENMELFPFKTVMLVILKISQIVQKEASAPLSDCYFPTCGLYTSLKIRALLGFCL